MRVSEITKLLNAEVCCGEQYLDRDIACGFACDMMSDVLAYVKQQAVLITGLVNPQVIRTADMMDISCVVIVRGKTPTDLMLELANEREITILRTDHRMYSVCGILYNNGLPADEGNA